ncbi:MAG: FAD-binding oxidoreductase [Chitinophagales bacterium]
MLLPWQTAVVREVIDETYTVRRFIFEVPGVDIFDFIPGQFVTLDLPIHERTSKRMRSYTIASAPDGNRFELVVVLLEHGSGSHWLFENAAVGTEISFRGPQGHFVLPDTFEREICFICTGTGVAPFRSMVEHIVKNKIPIPAIHLVFGTRYAKDILYHEEFLRLEKEIPHFHYHVTLSRETDTGWKGDIGYVHPIYSRICAEGKKDMEFYLCGWRFMINETRAKLAELGYPKERVHLELYD